MTLLLSLHRVCGDAKADLSVLTSSPELIRTAETLSVPAIPLSAAEYLPGETAVRKLLQLPGKATPLRGEARLRRVLRMGVADTFSAARRHHLDVLLPLLDVPPWSMGVATIGWIPDFQHTHLPRYFADGERRRRDRSVRNLAERASRVMVSSQDAASHFAERNPRHTGKLRIVPFPSLLSLQPLPPAAMPKGNPYGLPEKFVLVANQFWAHKNHSVVVDAISLAAAQGVRIPVVLTGLPSDPRDPANANLSALLQGIGHGGVHDLCFVLGQVPYVELVSLMRRAAVIIQPSRFEGWSTIVQDAKALGRPLLCADIPVLREQAPECLGFFPCDGPDVLAKHLVRLWPGLAPGPDAMREANALAEEVRFAARHGRALLELCLEATCG